MYTYTTIRIGSRFTALLLYTHSPIFSSCNTNPSTCQHYLQHGSMGNFSVFSVRVAMAMWVDMSITDTSHLHPCSLTTSHKAIQKVVHEVPTKEREAASSCVRFPESQSHTIIYCLIIEIIGRSAIILHHLYL